MINIILVKNNAWFRGPFCAESAVKTPTNQPPVTEIRSNN